MKIFGIGWHKTGTKTLGKCLSILGFKVQTWDEAVFDRWAEGGPEALQPIIETHDAFEDWPWSFCYRFLIERYPDSKFILTYRKNSKIWLDSYSRHAKSFLPLAENEPCRHSLIYGSNIPTEETKQQFIKQYEDHNDDVRNCFYEGRFFKKTKPNFLELCFEKGHGWKRLCSFLDRPVPRESFPHENKRPAL